MTPDDRPRADPVTPYCLMCVNGLHSKCLARTTSRFCECASCGWIWPGGMPDRFWRLDTTRWAREPAPASSAPTGSTNPATD